MMNRNLARGLFLITIALLFGITGARYPIGDFARAGPGLFPVLISGLLLLVGVASVIRARFMQPDPLEGSLKNIAIVIASLCAFAVISHVVNMILGIVAMVFISTLAGTSYSWLRNVKISVALIIIAFGFQRLLGLNLPLY